MAALMTSVIDSPKKVSEYILTCRNMGIALLPPNINQGAGGFSVSGDSIRYALTAIKGVGWAPIENIVEEREQRGPFTSLKDFITRTTNKEVSKRAVESFIKAGALDGLGGTRKQYMSVYVQFIDQAGKDKKNNLAGQLSLFDIAEDSQKEEFEIRLPDVGEYPKEMLLAFEKEVLGIYLSGHPLEAYQQLWQKHITHTTSDFALDQETGEVQAQDQDLAVVGGMIADRTIKYTRNDKVMAFLSLEDLVGNVEVVVFPKDYERYSALLVEEGKVFIKGRVSLEEDKDGKLIFEQAVSFEDAAGAGQGPLFGKRYNSRDRYNAAGQDRKGGQGASQGAKKVPKGIWIQFPNGENYAAREQELFSAVEGNAGNDDIVIYLKDTRAYKTLPPQRRVKAAPELLQKLEGIFGRENVKFR